MKMSKKEGLDVLNYCHFPTITPIDVNMLDENSSILQKGISVRTSPKVNRQNNAYLPSIHNQKNLGEIRKFIQENRQEYNIIAHETVRPEAMGSVSKMEIGISSVLAVEFFEDFEKRKKGLIRNRAYIPVEGEKMVISKMEMEKKDKKDWKHLRSLLSYLRKMPFSTYDLEFVIQEGEVLFTDLTIQNIREEGVIKDMMKEKKGTKAKDGLEK